MSSPVTVLIVEDHIKQRQKVEELLAKHFPMLQVVASCPAFKDAQQAIMEHQPQLWLLDVQLDGNNVSIPLLELGMPGSFEVVFITAETEYVLQNLLSQAAATLVKPFTEERFLLALNKALQNISLKKNNSDYNLILREFRQPEQLKEKIAFRPVSNKPKKEGEESDDLIDFIPFKSLVWLYSAGDHKTNLYCLKEGLTAPDCLPATRSLGEWETMLKHYNCFERVSRSAIVNLQYATGYNRTTNKIKLQYNASGAQHQMELEVEGQYKVHLLQHYNSVIKNPF